MNLWVANGRWALRFKVNGRQHGRVVMTSLAPWRYQVWRTAIRAGNSPWVEKWGSAWREKLVDAKTRAKK